MKLLHTSDWHVGKTLKGRPRLDEQKAVLAEIVALAQRARGRRGPDRRRPVRERRAHRRGAAAGGAGPCCSWPGSGIEVIAIAGNHDHGRDLRGVPAADGRRRDPPVRPGPAGRPRRRATGSPRARPASRPSSRCCRSCPSATPSRPPSSSRTRPAENVGAYDQMVRDILANLTGPFAVGPDREPGDGPPDLHRRHLRRRRTGRAVDHGISRAGAASSRSRRTTSRSATCTAGRRIPAPAPVHYSGAPLAVDFGEQDNTNVVCLVEVTPDDAGARSPTCRSPSGRRLRTVTGTVGELIARAGLVRRGLSAGLGPAGARTPGCASNCSTPCRTRWRSGSTRSSPPSCIPTRDRGRGAGDRTPAELFADYCAARRGRRPDRVARLFDQLHDELIQRRRPA